MHVDSRVLPLHNQPFSQHETAANGIGAADVNWLVSEGMLVGVESYTWKPLLEDPELTRAEAFTRNRLVRKLNQLAPMLRDKRENTNKNVAFLMNDLGPYGGIKVCQQAAAGLAKLGWNACVCYCMQTGPAFQYGASEFKFDSTEDLVDRFTSRVFSEGIVVLTHWWTAFLFKDLLKNNPKLKVVCYLQDREDWFLDEFGQPTLQPWGRDAYLHFRNRAYVASWIKETLEDKSDNPVIHPPLPQGSFGPSRIRPRPSERTGRIRVLSLWRPSTPRRGHALLTKVHTRLRELYGDAVSLEVYGEVLTPCETADINHGWLDEHEVLDLLGQVDVVLETSDFHGYGLAATEAMSQNVLVVSTENYGVEEYGIDEETLLLAGDTQEFIDKTCKVIDLCRTPWADNIVSNAFDLVSHEMDPHTLAWQWDNWLCQKLQQG